MTANALRRVPMSGAHLTAAIAAIVVATAVIPPAAAWSLNAGRISQTSRRVTTAVERLGSAAGDFAGAAGDLAGPRTTAGIVCGPGRLPTARAAGSHPAHVAWLREVQTVPALFGAGMPTDAWGRCFLMNVGAWGSGGPVWLLSAGPNGLVETPPNAMVLGGDDIGGRLR